MLLCVASIYFCFYFYDSYTIKKGVIEGKMKSIKILKKTCK